MRSLALLVLALAGCSDSLQPGVGDDPGSGTGTLRIMAIVGGSSNGESESASFLVYVYRDSVPVTDCRVTITSRSGSHVLGSDIRFPGKWSMIAEGYDQVYVLDVEAGADKVHDVRVDGPIIGVFTAPAESTTIDPAAPLEIQWEPSVVDSTSLVINPQGGAFGPIDDSGSYTIPANTLVSNPAGSHAIGLIRANTVTPEGAAADSMMMVMTDAYLHVCDRPATGLCSP